MKQGRLASTVWNSGGDEAYGVSRMDFGGEQVFENDDADLWSRRTVKQRHISAQILINVLCLVETTFFIGAVGVVYWLPGWNSGFTSGEVILSGIMASLVSCLTLSRCGAYRLECISGKGPWLGILFGGVCMGALVFALDLALLPTIQSIQRPSIGLHVAAWAGLALLMASGSRVLLAHLYSAWNLSDALRNRVALVGANEYGKAFIDRVSSDPDSGIEIVGLYDDTRFAGTEPPYGPFAVENLSDLIVRCRYDHIDSVILALAPEDTQRIDEIQYALRDITAGIYLAPELIGLRLDVRQMQAIGQTPVMSVRRRPLDDWQRLQKAVFDRLLAGMLLISLSPVLLIVSILIRLNSPGSILFRQPRLGFNNRIFTVYKFRTMYSHNDPASLMGDHQVRRFDARITPVGRWLRRYSIDELPQLLNVMRGEMSLVGPRPHPINTRVGEKLFHEAIDTYASRHRVLPGITGWAQVNGWRGETVVMEQIEQRVAHDLYYIENWSLSFDVRILFLTLAREIFSRNAF